jgi:hypothetical protein
LTLENNPHILKANEGFSSKEENSMRWHHFVVCAAVLALGQQAKADSTYGYSLGVSMQNTIVPGSTVSIEEVLLNTGSLPIVFAPSFPGGPPSVQGGSVPFAAISSGGQWSILDNGFSFGNFFGQFAGVTVAPGQQFQFTLGTFLAPTSQPLGTSATPNLNFGIDFTDTIEGNLNENNIPRPSYTLGNAPSSSDLTFFQGVVVNRETVSTPEPPTGILGLVAMLVGLAYVLATKRFQPAHTRRDTAPHA